MDDWNISVVDIIMKSLLLMMNYRLLLSNACV